MKATLKVTRAVLLAGLVSVASCGGGDSSPPPTMDVTCESATACGGDLVGSWTIASRCLGVDVSSFTVDCPGSTAYAQGYQIAGLVTYDANMMFRLTSTLTGSVVVKYPASCLTPPDGVQVTCEQLRAALLAPGKYPSVSCLSDDAACDCTIEMPVETFAGNGVYSTAEGVVLTGTDDQSDYCVKDDGTAELGTHPGSPIMGHPGLTTGSLVLTKK